MTKEMIAEQKEIVMDDDIRYLRKWLNEENTSPIDRVALATVLHEVVDLRDRMGGSEGLHRINAHKIKFLKDQLAAAQAQIKTMREALEAVRDQRIEGYVFPAVVDLNAWHSKVIDALATPPDDSALREMLAGYEAQIKVMREALEEIKLRSVSLADAQVTALEALTQPTDDSSLRKMLSKERERCAKVCEGYATGFPECSAKSFADAIRAMKDK